MSEEQEESKKHQGWGYGGGADVNYYRADGNELEDALWSS